MGKYVNVGKQVMHEEANDGGTTVVHIADAADNEKAHFLVTAANAYHEPFAAAVDDSNQTTLGELVAAILHWADARNLITGSNPQAQTVKLFEEGGELAGAVARKNLSVIEDSIGDMVVVLIIIAATTGLDFRTCVANAYDQIKDRKGKMADGVFIKDAE